MITVRDNVENVRKRITDAALRCGRSPDDVRVVGVTKTFGPDMVEALVAAGISDVGENRVQEFLEKAPAVTVDCRWHLIGNLQRNKAVKVVGRVELIQSVDSVKLAQTLSRLSVERGLRTRVLLQVNTSGEASKHGFEEGEVTARAAEVSALEGLSVEGLMTIGPLTSDMSAVRECFARLRDLRDDAQRQTGLSLPELSMGMSGDFEIAVEEGATIVRLGRVLTGERSR